MTEEIKKLKELIDGTDNIVFFGGAGVSTECTPRVVGAISVVMPLSSVTR